MAERHSLGEQAAFFGKEKPLRPLSALFASYFLSPYKTLGIDPSEALPDPAQFRVKAGELVYALERGENPLSQFCTEEVGVDSAAVERALVGRGKLVYMTVLLDLPRIAQRIFGGDYAAQLQHVIHHGVLGEIPEVEFE